MAARPSAQILAPLSRVDRVAGRMLRERDRKRGADERRRPGRADVEAHTTLMARLTEAHDAPFKRIDWDRLEAEGPLAPSVPRDAVSAAARKKLAAYRPSIADTLLGRERERRRELTAKVIEAAKADAELYARAKAAAEAHNRMLALAADVRALNVEAVAGVLKVNGGGKALKETVEAFRLYGEGGRRLVAEIDLFEFDALPHEACAAGTTGAACAPIPPAERAQLQLANAGSAALRVAIEVLQVAPVEAVEVVARLCRPGGMGEADFDTVLHVKVPAEALAKGALRRAEPAPALAALGARIAWTAAEGLAPIGLEGLRLTPQVAA